MHILPGWIIILPGKFLFSLPPGIQIRIIHLFQLPGQLHLRYDTAVVMLYNSLSRDINIDWTSGVPSSGTILLKANSSYRFAMPLSASAAYKFTNPTKESFVALEIADSYTPGGGGNAGDTRDWAFNLISESQAD